MKTTIHKWTIAQLEQLAEGGVIYSITMAISLSRVQMEAAVCTQIDGAGMKRHHKAGDN